MSVLLLYFKQFQSLRNLAMSLDGIDVIFELAALVELDEVSNLNQAIQF